MRMLPATASTTVSSKMFYMAFDLWANTLAVISFLVFYICGQQRDHPGQDCFQGRRNCQQLISGDIILIDFFLGLRLFQALLWSIHCPHQWSSRKWLFEPLGRHHNTGGAPISAHVICSIKNTDTKKNEDKHIRMQTKTGHLLFKNKYG